MSSEPQNIPIFRDYEGIENPPKEDLEKGPVRQKKNSKSILLLSPMKSF